MSPPDMQVTVTRPREEAPPASPGPAVHGHPRAARAAPAPAPGPRRGAGPRPPVPGAVQLAAVASLVAGAIHAAEAGARGGDGSLALVFAVTAALQLGWGALGLVRGGWEVGLGGAALNGVAVAAWALAKTTGLGLVAGLETAEGPAVADTLAAGLTALAVLGALAGVARQGTPAARPRPTLVGVAALAALALGVPSMVSAGGQGHARADGEAAAPGAGHDHGATVVAPQPFTGRLPVDLGGVPGVTPAEQASAEAVVTRTIERLPQFADPAVAEARGWHSIGDGYTGFEHFINWPLIDDGVTLDPDRPESLVYQIGPGQPRKLVAAMYMLPPSVPLDGVPDVGGPLVQWHIHNNLCFEGPDNSWTLAAVVPPDQPCPAGTFRFPNAPMIHVWIVPNECGPFAALQGVAAGQIAAGQVRLCDTAHGLAGHRSQ